MDPRLWPTLADAVAMLRSRHIGCAVIGGLAVSLRAQPRMTVDVDLVVDADVATALRLVAELPATSFDPLFPGVEQVVETSFILPLRHRQTGIRVDLAIGMSGFEREAVRRATPLSLGAGSVPVVTVEDLLVMKALAGRPQDEQDIRGLIDVHGRAIDWQRVIDVASALGQAIDMDLAGRLTAARNAAGLAEGGRDAT